MQDLNFKKKWQKAQRALHKSGVDCSYVYVHLEKDTQKIFYIGLGKTAGRPWDLNDRSEDHKNRVIEHGVDVQIITNSIHNWYIAAWWESWWIAACRAAGFDLVNLTNGGEGCRGLSEKSIEKIRKANLGKKYSSEVNLKKGRFGPKVNLTEEGREILKRPKSKETKLKMKQKALIVQSQVDQRKKNSLGCFKKWASRTEEEKTKIANKGWETRRRNKLLKEGIA